MPGAIFEYRLRADGSACIPFASDTIRDVYRVSPEDVREDAAKVFAVIHPDDLDGFTASLNASAQNLAAWQHEYRVKFDDGTVRWLCGRGLPQREKDGTVAWQCFVCDTTESKLTGQELRLEAFALNATDNAVLIVDTEAQIKWANQAYSTLTGTSVAEAIGQLPSELSDRSLQYMGFSAQIWQAIQSKKAWRGELINRHKNGHLYHEEMSISPVPNEQGEITHYVVVKQNITTRKEMERDLQYSREAMQRLLDSMEEGVYEIDALGYCIFVNRAFLQLLGYRDSSEVTGKHIHELIHHTHPDGTHYPKNECKINRIFLDQQPVNVADEVFWRKDGVSFPVEYWTHPIEMDGVVTGAITTFVDITERVRMNKQLLEQNHQLLDYSERVKEEENTAREFIKRFSALDKITDPRVQFILRPAENFSGDMIAVARAPDNRLHVLLADSAGHGLTAALAVIPITQPFYQMTAKGFDILDIATEINKRVRDYLQLPRYVACVMLSIDAETKTIEVWNGGCPAVLLLGEDGKEILHRFESKNLPMGVARPDRFKGTIEHFSHEHQHCQLLMLSDGATEITAKNGGPIGHDGLLSRAQRSNGGNLFDRIIDAIDHELDGSPPADDIALMVVQCASSAAHLAQAAV